MNGHALTMSDLPLLPWRNGAGLTREVVTRHGADGTVLAQLGLAELSADAPFSDFTGLHRVFTPLGADVELRFDGGPWLPCPAGCPVHFDGGARTELRLPNGPAQAFNVLVAGSTLRAGVRPALLMPGVGAGPLPHLAACVLLEGQLGSLTAGMIWLAGEAPALPMPVHGHARVLLVEIAAVPNGNATWTGWGAFPPPDPARPG